MREKLRWSHYNGRLPRLNRLAAFRFRKMMVSGREDNTKALLLISVEPDESDATIA
jgi:hypothetical protein